MRLDLVVVYLLSRFFYRLAAFFVHWYWHTFLIFSGWVNGLKSRFLRGLAGIILFFVYLAWALAPVYLVWRAFT